MIFKISDNTQIYFLDISPVISIPKIKENLEWRAQFEYTSGANTHSHLTKT